MPLLKRTQQSGILKDIQQHPVRQLSGGCILLARMIRTNQERLTVRNGVNHIVTEKVRRAGADDSLVFQNGKVVIEGQLSQGHHHLQAPQKLDFPL